MRMKPIYVVLAAMLSAFIATAAWSQATLATVNGKVTDGGKPVSGAQVTLTSLATGKNYKANTDKSGAFSVVGVARGDYQVEVKNSSGEGVYTQKRSITAEGGGTEDLTIDVSSGTSKGPKMTKEEVERIKAENAKATSLNALITQAQTALNAKNWAEAEPVLKQMITADPNRWQFYQALGNAQLNQGEYDDAVASFDKGIQLAQPYATGSVPKDPKNADTDPAKAKAGVGQMYALQGNAYLKLKKNPEAIAAFTKAAEMDPNPAVAYFNICATQYNTGNMEGAAAACDKAIQADPTKADAYFIKGSSLYGNGKLDANNKYVVPPGTTEALNKYLQLAPDGAHAADVKAMLQALGEPITTSYGKKKK